jgi:hypothetical protein
VRSAGTSGFVGGVRTPGFGGGGGFRGGWGGYGWAGGFGRWGWGGWGFGIGWPYWAFGWNPYWYNPYWYGPWSYSYYPDYSYDWSDDPPPYRPDSDKSPGSHVSAPDSNLSPNYHLSSGSNSASTYDDRHFDVTSDLNMSDSSSVENGQTPQLEAVPAQAAQP